MVTVVKKGMFKQKVCVFCWKVSPSFGAYGTWKKGVVFPEDFALIWSFWYFKKISMILF